VRIHVLSPFFLASSPFQHSSARESKITPDLKNINSVKQADNSLWTETPAERQQRIADEVLGKRCRAANAEDKLSPEEALEAQKKRRRDEKIKNNVDEYTVCRIDRIHSWV
jgi:hypothetical protein